jgi:predicted aconitase
VSTARTLLADAEEEGLAGRLRALGVELLVDTCSYIAPVLRPSPLPAMTDSGKWAFYAPGNIGVEVVFGSLRECVRSAVEGRVWRDADAWGTA